MFKTKTLELFLYDELIGTIIHLPGERNLFTFTSNYIENQNRSTLSLSFKNRVGNLITDIKSTRTRLPPFFSNLLPEGALRDFLAGQVKVHPDREFQLLEALGADLPGAISVQPAEEGDILGSTAERKDKENRSGALPMHFSLAGVQLKFSAIWNSEARLTIPAAGIGGSWIVKLPSANFMDVPENEFAMMSLAKEVGIEVPQIALVPVDQISGIPSSLTTQNKMAYAIERFDRKSDGSKVHIEDFAQVLGVYPEQKYKMASYATIASIIAIEVGAAGVEEFIRRLVFNALIGNGDMHLKNWSLIYPDRRTAKLAPAYDFVSTIPYIPEDALALRFVRSKLFADLTLEEFSDFATRAQLPQTVVLDTLSETVRRFKVAWKHADRSALSSSIWGAIDAHLQHMPLL